MDDILSAQPGAIPEAVLREFSTKLDEVISKKGDPRDPGQSVK